MDYKVEELWFLWMQNKTTRDSFSLVSLSFRLRVWDGWKNSRLSSTKKRFSDENFFQVKCLIRGESKQAKGESKYVKMCKGEKNSTLSSSVFGRIHNISFTVKVTQMFWALVRWLLVVVSFSSWVRMIWYWQHLKMYPLLQQFLKFCIIRGHLTDWKLLLKRRNEIFQCNDSDKN